MLNSEPELLYEQVGGCATITLNRPEKRNALSASLVARLRHAFTRADKDCNTCCVILTGNGSAFCSGIDLDQPPNHTLDSKSADSYPEVLRTMTYLKKPIVAMVNGAAFAGGLGLIGAADIVVVDEAAMMSFSEVRIGVIPAVISVVCMPKLGLNIAKKLFLTAERFDGKQAVKYGLAHEAVPQEQLHTRTMYFADQLIKAGPIALENCKKLTREIPNLDFEDGLKYASKWSQQLFSSAEAQEGIQAFREKRRPKWIRDN